MMIPRTIPPTKTESMASLLGSQSFSLHDLAALRRPELIAAGELEGGDKSHLGLLIMRIIDV
jgi:hypothetical protein